ncbi:hypothetical protein HYV83_02790 [Candidatus Woesearchaeota archaeon]|nr:hypothetical protein [Candidatus Woesearchaeota archaeon]
MIRQYNFDHSSAVAAGGIYPSNPFWETGWSSFVHNGKDPSHITIANLCYGAQSGYFMLLATAETPAVVHQKLAELKRQFGIRSGPVQHPPSELETELATSLMALQAQFEQLKMH